MACGWTPSYIGCEGDKAFLEAWDAEAREAAETMATDLLDAWTGGQYGACPVTIRPCRGDRPADPSRALHEFTETALSRRAPWQPVLVDGRWFNLGCGSCGHRCGCDGPSTLDLPWPVAGIESILIDGETLPPSAYRVDGHRRLVRTDGGSWPTTQNLAAEPTEPGTFAVTYLHGLEVPVGGQVAAGVLAMELGKALCDDNTCRLPERVQTITRQGVSVAMLDSFEGLEQGRTGIWAVDSWVASVTEAPRRSAVMSPDYGRRR